MKRVLLLLIGLACVMPLAARPHGPPPPAPWRPHFRPHPPRWGWGVSVSPWGSAFSLGTRVGRHGAFGLTLPLCPPPVVRETTTVVVQPPAQQTLVVPQTVVVQPDPAAQEPAARVPGILPGLATTNAIPAKVWVEGYWRVLRDETGAETSRTWVPGHWEETTR